MDIVRLYVNDFGVIARDHCLCRKDMVCVWGNPIGKNWGGMSCCYKQGHEGRGALFLINLY